ncbi:MAG: hypothetical protein ABH856_05130 [Patescibacteria group bacterium]|nr:hypothetical protein [Patescibacteria group bacterium]
MSDKGEQEVKIKKISDPVEEDSFEVHHIDDEADVASGDGPVSATVRPGEIVKIKFSNFVNLVASHNFQKVVDKHQDEDVVVSTNLLADLANAHEDKEEKKLPVIFAIGLIVGIILTYLLFRY